MKNALIIFVRNPELGKVKTRVAAKIGAIKALEVYIKLLEHTREVALGVNCHGYVFSTEPLSGDFWAGFFVESQVAGNLGEKMSDSFHRLFELGYQKVLIIGSDCFELTRSHIDEAFDNLFDKDVVIGPSVDGGYYLLGLKKHQPQLFKNKTWSTSSVFSETIDSVNALNLSYYLLAPLNDVDEADDIPESWR